MGKIDKEKLLEEFSCVGSMCLYDVRKVIKNFPEEQEIDFDALWKEYEEKYSCKKTVSCDNCTYPNKLYYTTICFVDFLKSKNLTQPQVDMDALRNEIYASIQKPSEIPVKKTWTLKKEYEKYSRIIGHTPTTLIVDPTVAPDPEFYDYKEEPDYSQVPVGAYIVVKFKEFNRSKCGVVCQHYRDFFNIDTGDFHHSVPYNGDGVESIEILKMPENVK